MLITITSLSPWKAAPLPSQLNTIRTIQYNGRHYNVTWNNVNSVSQPTVARAPSDQGCFTGMIDFFSRGCSFITRAGLLQNKLVGISAKESMEDLNKNLTAIEIEKAWPDKFICGDVKAETPNKLYTMPAINADYDEVMAYEKNNLLVEITALNDQLNNLEQTALNEPDFPQQIKVILDAIAPLQTKVDNLPFLHTRYKKVLDSFKLVLQVTGDANDKPVLATELSTRATNFSKAHRDCIVHQGDTTQFEKLLTEQTEVLTKLSKPRIASNPNPSARLKGKSATQECGLLLAKDKVLTDQKSRYATSYNWNCGKLMELLRSHTTSWPQIDEAMTNLTRIGMKAGIAHFLLKHDIPDHDNNKGHSCYDADAQVCINSLLAQKKQLDNTGLALSSLKMNDLEVSIERNKQKIKLHKPNKKEATYAPIPAECTDNNINTPVILLKISITQFLEEKIYKGGVDTNAKKSYYDQEAQAHINTLRELVNTLNNPSLHLSPDEINKIKDDAERHIKKIELRNAYGQDGRPRLTARKATHSLISPNYTHKKWQIENDLSQFLDKNLTLLPTLGSWFGTSYYDEETQARINSLRDIKTRLNKTITIIHDDQLYPLTKEIAEHERAILDWNKQNGKKQEYTQINPATCTFSQLKESKYKKQIQDIKKQQRETIQSLNETAMKLMQRGGQLQGLIGNTEELNGVSVEFAKQATHLREGREGITAS